MGSRDTPRRPAGYHRPVPETTHATSNPMTFFDEIDRRERRARLYVVLLSLAIGATALLVPGLFVGFMVGVGNAAPADFAWAWFYVPPIVLLIITLGALVDEQKRRVPLLRQWEKAGQAPPRVSDEHVPPVLRNVAEEMQIAALSGVSVHVELLADRDDLHVDIQSDGGTALVRITPRTLDELSRDALQAVLAFAVARAQEPRVRSERLLLSAIDGLSWLRASGVMLVEMSAAAMMGATALAGGEPNSLPGFIIFLIRLAIATVVGLAAMLLIISGICVLLGGGIANISSRLVLRQLNHERVHAADARAIQYTRFADGLREALEKCQAASLSAGRHAPRELWRHICRNELGSFVGAPTAGWREAFVRVHPTTERRLEHLSRFLPAGVHP